MAKTQTETVTIRVDNTIMKRLREEAGRDYRTVGSLIRKLLSKGLDTQ